MPVIDNFVEHLSEGNSLDYILLLKILLSFVSTAGTMTLKFVRDTICDHLHRTCRYQLSAHMILMTSICLKQTFSLDGEVQFSLIKGLNNKKVFFESVVNFL